MRFGNFIKTLFWILGCLMVLTGVITVFFDDMNWTVTEAMRTLALYNTLLGGSIILGLTISIAIKDIFGEELTK